MRLIFHEGEGTGKELISGTYNIAKIIKRKYPELELIKLPELYDGHEKLNKKAEVLFEKLNSMEQTAMISGAIRGDNTYHFRIKNRFIYKCYFSLLPKFIVWSIIYCVFN